MQQRSFLFFLLFFSSLMGGITPPASAKQPLRATQTATPPTTLKDRIDDLLIQSGLEKSLHSIQITALPEGTILYQKNADLLLNPASNVKIVTAAVALRELGPDFTFKTEFYSDSLINKEGILNHLWIKGFGDPLFVTEELASIVQRFQGAGLKKIEGDVFLDDTYFDRYHLTTYLSDINERIYSIVTGPLSFNFNSIEIRARPGSRLGDQPIIVLEPPTRYIALKNKARTVGRGRHPRLEAIVPENNENEIVIQGSLPKAIREYSFRRGILDPATYTGTVVLEALQNVGIEIKGGLKREAVPSHALSILTHSSPPLREVLKGLGKYSNNFIAEQLVKAIAAHRGPPGSTSRGLTLFRDYLASLGFSPKSFTLDNGSGLSRLSRLSAEQMTRVLIDLYHSPWQQDFISSLSIAGIDGTLKLKMCRSRLLGKVFAKTGTLNDAHALSGYLLDGERRIAFSFLFNDFHSSSEKISMVEEKILTTVLDHL